ncbi:Elongator subunit elp2 [Umbelopsis nana]
MTGYNGGIDTIACVRATSIDSSDGDIIATGSGDGNIRIWIRREKDDETDDVESVQVIECGVKYPTALALSYLPGTTIPILATGNTDRKISVYIYEPRQRQFAKSLSLPGHDNWIRSLQFATYTQDPSELESRASSHTLRHGDLILASGSQDKYIRLWKVSPEESSGKQVSTSSEPAAETDGGTLTKDMLEALEESVKTGESMQLSTKAHLFEAVDNDHNKRRYTIMFEALLMGHDDWVYSVCWQPPIAVTDANGQQRLHQPMRILSASSDKSMMIWRPDPDTGVWINEVRVGEIGGNTLGFYGGLFSPDGRHIIAHGSNGSFHLWHNISTEEDLNHWVPQVSISGHFGAVESLVWDPQNLFVVSASLDQTCRVFAPWNRQVDGQKTSTWHEMGRSQIHGYDMQCVAFIDKWRYVSGADEKVMRIFDAPKTFMESLAALTEREELLTQMESRPVGANLPALGLSNKAVFEGDASTMFDENEDAAALQSYAHPSATPTSLLQTLEHPPFEEHLMQHTLWPEIEKLYGHGYEIRCVRGTHDGRLIASSCKASTPEHAVIRLFDTKTWNELETKLEGHNLTVTKLEFSHDDKYLLSVSRDRLWSVYERVETDEGVTYKLASQSKAHARIIWDCSWSHDDKLFATASRDKTIKIWQKADTNWTCAATIKCTEAITAVDFAPRLIDDKYVLAAGLENGQIQLLESQKGSIEQWQLVSNLEAQLCHVGVVNAIAWNNQTSQDSHKLQFASAGNDHAVRIFNAVF